MTTLSTLSDAQRFKRGSTGDPLKLVVKNEAGVLVNLSVYAAVRIRWRRRRASRETAQLLSAVIVTGDDTHNLRHNWTEGELEIAGRYLVEVEVENLDGTVRTVPQDSAGLEIEIFDDTG